MYVTEQCDPVLETSGGREGHKYNSFTTSGWVGRDLFYSPKVGVVPLFVFGRCQVTRLKATGRNDGCLGIFLYIYCRALRCQTRNGGRVGLNYKEQQTAHTVHRIVLCNDKRFDAVEISSFLHRLPT